MTKHFHKTAGLVFPAIILMVVLTGGVKAQNFDFDRLQDRIRDYTVILKVQVEISFGTQTNEHEERLLGTIVTDDGLVVFDGGFLSEESPFVPTSSFSFRTTPRKIEVSTLDEEKFSAEYVGVDRYTGLGFAQITGAERQFQPVEFVPVDEFEVGRWFAVFMLLPEFVEPPLAADIGMISNLVTAPEEFPLTVGFNSLEFASVLFDEQLNAVGMLGELTDPIRQGPDGGGLMESFGRMELPLLGVITADRLEVLIADPPRRGVVDRSWLGITMQALTPDIADFLGIGSPGGIIVNEVIPGSPANACGLVVGDVIYAVDNQPVGVDRDEELVIFQRQISTMGVGTTVELEVLRPTGDRLDSLRLPAVLKAAPLAASDAEEYEFEAFELTVRNMVFSDFLNYNVEQNTLEGVVVSGLKPGGLANVSGLRPADIVQRVNDQVISSVDDFSRYMTSLEETKPTEVIFFVWRFGQTMFVNVKTDWP